MNIKVREFNESDIQAANEIWNEVVEDGVAFPQEECLTEKSGLEFFMSPDERIGFAPCDPIEDHESPAERGTGLCLGRRDIP